MNLFKSFESLVEQFISSQPPRETVALYPGGFKPPTKGHFNALAYILQDAHSAKVYIGKKERDGITAEQSKAIWDLYKPYLKKPIDVIISDVTPVKSVYDYADQNKEKNILVGAGPEDADRFNYFIKNQEKYPLIRIINIPPQNDRISGTKCREKINNRDMDCVDYFVPNLITPADRQVITSILFL